MPDESTRTVLVAIGADLGVPLAKVGAAVFTGCGARPAGFPWPAHAAASRDMSRDRRLRGQARADGRVA